MIDSKHVTSAMWIFALIIGNAEILNIDISLVILMILTVIGIHQYDRNPLKVNYKQASIMMLVLCMPLMLLAASSITVLEMQVLTLIKIILACLSFNVVKIEPNSFEVNFLLVVVIVLLIGASFESGRLYSYFGPNMLYRIFLYGALIWIIYSVNIGARKFYAGSVILLMLAASIATASVGAAVIILSLFLKYLIFNRRGSIFVKISIGLLGLLVAYLLLTMYSEAYLVSRILFKIEDGGGYRSYGISELLTNSYPFIYPMSYGDFSYLWVDGYPYPHNIVVELLVYYGVAGLAVSLILISIMLRVFIQELSSIKGLYIIIFLASFFSGDLNDNFGLIVLAVFLVGNGSKDRRMTNQVKQKRKDYRCVRARRLSSP